MNTMSLKIPAPSVIFKGRSSHCLTQTFDLKFELDLPAEFVFRLNSISD